MIMVVLVAVPPAARMYPLYMEGGPRGGSVWLWGRRYPAPFCNNPAVRCETIVKVLAEKAMELGGEVECEWRWRHMWRKKIWCWGDETAARIVAEILRRYGYRVEAPD